MGAGQWLKVLDTVSGLAAAAGRFRRGMESDSEQPASGGGGGGLAGPIEARLAGVVVAALQEAFDRDRARMDLERSQVEAERRRAEEALAAELRRQAAERALGQFRMIAVMAMAVWMLSAALAAWVPGMRSGAALVLLGLGWLSAFGSLGAAFAGWQHVSMWSADARNAAAQGAPHRASAAAPWLLLAALALTGAALLVAFSTRS
jgi:hypothetical protein